MAPPRTALRTAASDGSLRMVCIGTSASCFVRASWNSPCKVDRSIASGFSAMTGSPRSRQTRVQCGMRSPRPQTCTTSSRSVSSIFRASSYRCVSIVSPGA